MKFNRLAFASTLGLISGGAMASSSCSEVFYNMQQGYTGYTPSEARQKYPECFPSASPSATQQINATSFQQVTAISSGLGSRLLGTLSAGGPQRQALNGVTGLAAGAVDDKWNGWLNASQNASRYDATVGATRTKTGTDITNFVFGGDYRLSPATIVGISAALDRGTGAVGVGAQGTVTSGYTIAPYVGYQLSSKLALDASIGFGEGRNSMGAARTDVDRMFVAGNATYAEWVGNWQLVGKAGYLWAREKSADTRNNGAVLVNSASTARVAQARVGIDAGYWWGDGIMPFVGVAYSSDVIRAVQGNALWDRDGFTVSAGVNFFSLKDKITGGIVYTDETGRRYTRNSTLMGNLNIRF